MYVFGLHFIFWFIVHCNFMLDSPLYNPNRDKFPSLIENVGI